MNRGYQFGFAAKGTAMYDIQSRERKARTMVAVLDDYFGDTIHELSVLNIGGSAGIIDSYLANHLGSVCGIDIDAPAIEHAHRTYNKQNLEFAIGDALNLAFPAETFDVVICSQVYEHVADPKRMMNQIFHVLKPSGICYFAANNRLMLNEPHYSLPLLSVLPRPMAHAYVKLCRRADFYYEKHLTYWGLKRLTRQFIIHDYTLKLIQHPQQYSINYMIKSGTAKATIARFVAKYLQWLSPSYVWLLEKPIHGVLATSGNHTSKH